jgi:hypothetical protein
LGYSNHHKGYKCLYVFDENLFPFATLLPIAGAQYSSDILLPKSPSSWENTDLPMNNNPAVSCLPNPVLWTNQILQQKKIQAHLLFRLGALNGRQIRSLNVLQVSRRQVLLSRRIPHLRWAPVLALLNKLPQHDHVLLPRCQLSPGRFLHQLKILLHQIRSLH